jgi:hypothetical protein
MGGWRSMTGTAWRLRGSAGFTFLEILVALCIVLLALVPLLHLHMASIRMLDAGVHEAKAALLANDKMGEILAQETPEAGQSGGRVADANDGTVYRWTAVVAQARPAEVDALPLLGLRQVRVDVAWENCGREALVSLGTYVYVPVVGERKILENASSEKSNRPTVGPSPAAL